MNERDQKVIERYIEGVSIKEIGSEFNISAMTIYNILNVNNIERNRETGNKLKKEMILNILYKYFQEFKTQEEIAQELDICIVTVRTYISKYKKDIFLNGIKNINIE